MPNPADPAFLDRLGAALPPDTLRAAEPQHLTEPRGRWQGQAACLARPRSTDDVATILRLCNDAAVGVVPLGGGTGLVGGQVCAEGPAPILLSLDRMTAIREVLAEENVLLAEAGAILSNVHAAAEAVGRRFPLSLASEGSARIGGLLATNAGGVNVLRYGNARDLCLGLEAVLADGSVLRGLKRLRKDNTGYDLRHLLIGSEGTLGVITAASLRLVAPPAGVGAILMAVADPTAALELLHLAETEAPGCVSAFEIMHRTGFEFLAQTMTGLHNPLRPLPDWTVLMELGLPRGLDPQAALEAIYVGATDAGLATDGVLAASEAQRAAFWALRENIPEANRRVGALSSHDVSLPLGQVGAFIAKAGPAIADIGPLRINCFGHLGDGNLHYNVFPPSGGRVADHADKRGAIQRCVHDIVHALGGSISAEHGIGRHKVDDLERYGDPARLAAMRAIKAALDPAGILNPGAVLRA
jgi:FAD/FMN-containing dehydrogenase